MTESETTPIADLLKEHHENKIEKITAKYRNAEDGDE